MRSTISMALLIAGLAIATPPAQAHDLMTLDELMGAFGWDFDSAEITAEQHGEGLYVLFGLGGNIAVSIGEDGVLIVDDQFPQLVPKIEAKISELGGGAVDFVINTHWHFTTGARNFFREVVRNFWRGGVRHAQQTFS